MDQQQRQAAAAHDHQQKQQQQQQQQGNSTTTGDSANRSQRLHQLRAQHQKRHAEQRQSTHTPTEQFEYEKYSNFRRLKWHFNVFFSLDFFLLGRIIRMCRKSFTDARPVTILTTTWGNPGAGQLSANPILLCPFRPCPPPTTTTITTNFNSSKYHFFFQSYKNCKNRLFAMNVLSVSPLIFNSAPCN